MLIKFNFFMLILSHNLSLCNLSYTKTLVILTELENILNWISILNIFNYFLYSLLIISNLCTVFIAITSIFVRKKSSYFVKWNEKFFFIKNNFLTFVIIFVLFVLIVNILRLPLFLFLGREFIMYNSYTYIFCLVSTILPLVYTLNVLEKKLKTGLWDFSFAVKELNNKITLISLAVCIFSLYISYNYIWPLVILSISCFEICKHILLLGLFEKIFIFSKKYNAIFLTIPLLLQDQGVDGIFRHFNSNNFQKTDLTELIDSPNRTIEAGNTADFSRVKFSENQWLSKSIYTKYVNEKMSKCASSILVPCIPKDSFYSFWSVPEIAERLSNPDQTMSLKQTMLNVITFYFNHQSNLFSVYGGPSSQRFDTGQVNISEDRPPMDIQTTFNKTKHCLVVGRNNKSWHYILQELPRYIDHDLKGEFSAGKSPYIIFYKDEYIAFAEYKNNYHNNYPLKKPTDLNREATINAPDYSGILGLVATPRGVEAVPQQNMYSPQLAFYNIKDEKHALAIDMQFKYLILNKDLVERDANFNPMVMDLDPNPNNTIDITPPNPGRNTYDVGLLLNKKGILVRKI